MVCFCLSGIHCFCYHHHLHSRILQWFSFSCLCVWFFIILVCDDFILRCAQSSVSCFYSLLLSVNKITRFARSLFYLYIMVRSAHLILIQLQRLLRYSLTISSAFIYFLCSSSQCQLHSLRSLRCHFLPSPPPLYIPLLQICFNQVCIVRGFPVKYIGFSLEFGFPYTYPPEAFSANLHLDFPI